MIAELKNNTTKDDMLGAMKLFALAAIVLSVLTSAIMWWAVT